MKLQYSPASGLLGFDGTMDEWMTFVTSMNLLINDEMLDCIEELCTIASAQMDDESTPESDSPAV